MKINIKEKLIEHSVNFFRAFYGDFACITSDFSTKNPRGTGVLNSYFLTMYMENIIMKVSCNDEMWNSYTRFMYFNRGSF